MKRVIAGIISGTVLLASTAANPTGTERIIEVRYGEKVVSYGFADLGGTTYASKDNLIIIDDEAYKNPVEKRKAFTNAIASGSVKRSAVTDTPAFILVKGTIDLSDGKISDKDHSALEKFDPASHKRLDKDITFPIGANKTIIGAEDAKIAFGGLSITATSEKSARNIVIRNILFWDAHGATELDTKFKKDSKASIDQLVIQGTPAKGSDGKDNGEMTYVPSDIWIDHCTFTDGLCKDLDRNFNHDGSLDVKAVHNMTVSYCEFTNHDKVTLVGPGDKFVKPEDRQITFHNNWYHGAVQRMPRSRGCQIHLYNNCYENIGTPGNSGYSLGPGIGSQFIVENNYFGSHQGKILRVSDSSAAGSETFYRLYNKGNKPELNSSNSEKYKEHHVEVMPWKIGYEYTLKAPEEFSREETGSGCKVNFN